jgi:hypothetical protein
LRILGNPTLSRGRLLETTHALHDDPAVGAAADVDLVGREDELARVRRFIDDVAEGPRAVVVSGEPGIGKTMVSDAGLEAAGVRWIRAFALVDDETFVWIVAACDVRVVECVIAGAAAGCEHVAEAVLLEACTA